MEIRVCKRCGEAKELAEFHRVAACKGGRRPVCIACVNRQRKDRDQANLAEVRAKGRERMRRFREEHGCAAPTRERMRDWEKRNPEKKRAHWRVRDALRVGKLTKGTCEVCGSEAVHAHHDDYSKPLEVRWLCPAHHMEQHRLETA